MKNDFLNKIGFTVKNGLVHHLDEARNNVERLYIEEAKKLNVPADAVFFRRYYKNDEEELPYFSTPAVCIFHQSDSFFNTEPHKDLHAALWSAGKTEIYIICGETRIDIINARKPAKRADDDVSLDDEDLLLAQEAIEAFDDARFSAHLFGSGTFWEQSEFQDKIDGNSNPYVFLLDYLMEVRAQLLNNKTIGLKSATIDKLLITCILIKFLEEIKDDDGKHTLKTIYKTHNLEPETFEEGLRKGVCVSILKDLVGEFNGEIFNTFSQEEVLKISKADLKPIADFLSANIDVRTSQGFIWKQYSFKHLPAEVISAIYENFIQAEAERNAEERKDVVYTPLHLVNLMIDEAMPLDQPELFKNNQFRVLDPACGSGVFLVAAYKRMLQWWAINNWQATGQIIYPDKEAAKQILEDNIFGVDIEEVAALVSIFGLTTAFLDKLTPKEVWNNLKFKDLSEKNIQGLNFIDWAKPVKEREERFDLVIGNPPFNPSKKGTITDKAFKDLFGKQVPGNKLALKFFEAALYFGKKVCMIIPSNVFLYNKSNPSQEYRKEIFTNYTVEKIYDFTHLRESLFVKKNIKSNQQQKRKTGRTPVLALVVQNMPSGQQFIEHTIVKLELLSEQKLRFEIDYYDKHQVRWDWAIDDKKQFIWKTNLLGGGRLFHLIYRLSLLENFEDFIKEKINTNSGWIYSVGYKTEGLKKTQNVDYIFKKPSIITKTFDDNEDFETQIEENQDFSAPRNRKIYEPPHLILKVNIGKKNIPVHYSEKYVCFKDKLIGLHAPNEEKDALIEIYKRFKKTEYATLSKLWIYATSAESIINLETTCKKEDIDSLPYPQNEKYLKVSDNESIIINDVLTSYIHLGKSISQNSAGKILHDPVTQEELRKFGKTYCDALNEIYAEDGKSWQVGQVLQTSTFVSYQVGFGKEGGLRYDLKKDAEKDLQALLNNFDSNNRVSYKRIIRHYKHVDGYDCVYFIKLRARRYWLQSIALRDADDTFLDLKKSGY